MKMKTVFVIAVALCAGCVSQGIRRPQRATPASPAYVEPQLSDKEAATFSGTMSFEATNMMGVGIGRIDGIRVSDKTFNSPLKIKPGRRTVTLVGMEMPKGFGRSGIVSSKPFDVSFDAIAGHAYQAIYTAEGAGKGSVLIKDLTTNMNVDLQIHLYP